MADDINFTQVTRRFEVSVDLVDRTMRQNADKATRLFIAAVAAVAKRANEFDHERDEAQKLAKAAIM